MVVETVQIEISILYSFDDSAKYRTVSEVLRHKYMNEKEVKISGRPVSTGPFQVVVDGTVYSTGYIESPIKYQKVYDYVDRRLGKSSKSINDLTS